MDIVLINPNTTVAITEAVVVGCFDDHQQISRSSEPNSSTATGRPSTIFWGSTGAFPDTSKGQESAMNGQWNIVLTTRNKRHHGGP